MDRILVTGAFGFVGRHLLVALRTAFPDAGGGPVEVRHYRPGRRARRGTGGPARRLCPPGGDLRHPRRAGRPPTWPGASTWAARSPSRGHWRRSPAVPCCSPPPPTPMASLSSAARLWMRTGASRPDEHLQCHQGGGGPGTGGDSTGGRAHHPRAPFNHTGPGPVRPVRGGRLRPAGGPHLCRATTGGAKTWARSTRCATS